MKVSYIKEGFGTTSPSSKPRQRQKRKDVAGVFRVRPGNHCNPSGSLIIFCFWPLTLVSLLFCSIAFLLVP